MPDATADYTIEFSDNTSAKADSLRQDPFLDLAVLKVKIPSSLSGLNQAVFVPRDTLFSLGQFLYRISYGVSDPLGFGVATLSSDFAHFGDKKFKPYIVFAQASKPGQS